MVLVVVSGDKYNVVSVFTIYVNGTRFLHIYILAVYIHIHTLHRFVTQDSMIESCRSFFSSSQNIVTRTV